MKTNRSNHNNSGGIVIDLNSGNKKKKINIDKKKIFTRLVSFSIHMGKGIASEEEKTSELINAAEDFVYIVCSFSISKTVDGLAWSLIKNSLLSATVDLLKSLKIEFRKKDIKEDALYAIKESEGFVVDYNFILNPAKSEFSEFYCNKLCYWLSLFTSEQLLNEIRQQWPLCYTRAFTAEWLSREDYKKILEHVNPPMKEAIEELEDLTNYSNHIIERAKQNVFDENISLESIYIDLKGLFFYPQESRYDTCDICAQLHSWINDYHSKENICTVYGDPGSGKSTVMKTLAATLVQSGHRVILIDLFKLNFSTIKPAYDVLMDYIHKIKWMKNYDIENDKPIILILDGLDEIIVNVWENALALIRELRNVFWKTEHKVILSGRKKILDYCVSATELFLTVEVLPLYMSKEVEPNKCNSEYDLRVVYWDKLCSAFNINYDVDRIIHGEHLRDLSMSPLLLFLLAWTIKNSNRPIEEIRHSAELYNDIIDCIYTRKYNRLPHDLQRNDLEDFKHMLQITGLCAWHNNMKSIYMSTVEKYCEIKNKPALFKRWIDYHKNDNPSKLLLFFFFREKLDTDDFDKSEIEFIHKSFYEYLASLEIMQELFRIKGLKAPDFYVSIFDLLSKNLLGVEVTEFIEGTLESDEEQLNKYVQSISSIFPRVFNIEWPVQFCIRNSLTDINITNYYSSLKQSIRNIEENVLRLAEIVSNIRKRNSAIKIMLQCEVCELKNVNLMWKSLPYSLFSGSDFSEAIMTGGEFYECDFQNSSFRKALLNNCILEKSNLKDCTFDSAHLEAASLSEAIFDKAKFDGAFLDGAFLCDTKIFNTSFCSATLIGSNFDNSVLKGVNFTDANLERADMSNVTIEDVIWKDCSLKDAKLHNVKMEQFNHHEDEIVEMLMEADLSGADWKGVDDEIKKMYDIA